MTCKDNKDVEMTDVSCTTYMSAVLCICTTSMLYDTYCAQTSNACGIGEHNSKTEAMFIPSSLEEAQTEKETPHTSFTINGGKNNVHFVRKFKYLRCIITVELMEDAKIEIRIKKSMVANQNSLSFLQEQRHH